MKMTKSKQSQKKPQMKKQLLTKKKQLQQLLTKKKQLQHVFQKRNYFGVARTQSLRFMQRKMSHKQPSTLQLSGSIKQQGIGEVMDHLKYGLSVLAKKKLQLQMKNGVMLELKKTQLGINSGIVLTETHMKAVMVGHLFIDI